MDLVGVLTVRRRHEQVGLSLGEQDGHTVRPGQIQCLRGDVIEPARHRCSREELAIDLRDRFEQLLATLPFVEEASILDGDASGDGEGADELFIDLGELRCALLLAQIEISEDFAAHPHRNA